MRLLSSIMCWTSICHVWMSLITCVLLLGVYLSLGGSIIPPHGVMILVTNIGTSSNQLVCTSDRKPCCQDQPQIGGWYFPNQSRVLHLSEQPTPTAFHSDRNNRGGISLYRTSSDIVSPIGQFCCETMDATSSNHTLCVNVCEYTSRYSLKINVMICILYMQLLQSLLISLLKEFQQ